MSNFCKCCKWNLLIIKKKVISKVIISLKIMRLNDQNKTVLSLLKCKNVSLSELDEMSGDLTITV